MRKSLHRNVSSSALHLPDRVTGTDGTGDPGLEQIQAWHDWFISAHTQRLRDSNLPADQHDRELADVTRIAAAIAQRMREDYYLTRTR